MNRLRDADIRRALRRTVLAPYVSDPDTVVIDELTLLQGAVRVDLAVVNGQFHGFEIKSEADTLERLPRQAQVYNRIFDLMTLVISPRRIDDALSIIPAWWGVISPESLNDATLEFRPIRQPAPNDAVDPRALAELLWRSEVLGLLAARGADAGYRSKPRRVLWTRLCEVYTSDEIRQVVRDRLRVRYARRSESR